jgi:energy-converting hydrogenase Eha subunit A
MVSIDVQTIIIFILVAFIFGIIVGATLAKPSIRY